MLIQYEYLGGGGFPRNVKVLTDLDNTEPAPVIHSINPHSFICVPCSIKFRWIEKQCHIHEATDQVKWQ